MRKKVSFIISQYMKNMLMHLNSVLQVVPKVEQLLSYDTTFLMRDFYVSALLFKHSILEESPVVPALFLVHERKFQSHHQHLFEVLRRYCKGNLKNIALATDMQLKLRQHLKWLVVGITQKRI